MFGPMMEVRLHKSTSSPIQLPWEHTRSRVSRQQVICERNSKTCQEDSELASKLEGLPTLDGNFQKFGEI
ncbi:hypothetical protein NG798_16010 [Ancylothrix sp. C2]|uniref:hypothetical protein n=1 Tax=Ancylothrix sp. D3o TaxID=2953691 RepID=UPI0021BBA6FF|nr:hypothetical protein [Ancylothrix sp. D3o]MCT7951306.1 hypothetical protein [Ancylothrix sp. D3o]